MKKINSHIIIGKSKLQGNEQQKFNKKEKNTLSTRCSINCIKILLQNFMNEKVQSTP